jgi:hypothetical protein
VGAKPAGLGSVVGKPRAEAGDHLVALGQLLFDDVADVGVGGMILSHCLQVTVAVGLMTGQHAVVDVVGGQHLPQRVQVTLGMRFQEAPNQGFVLPFLSRHRSFLLTL